MGGHLDACLRCDHQAISYNSCRNRHCPKCQAKARERWLTARTRTAHEPTFTSSLPYPTSELVCSATHVCSMTCSSPPAHKPYWKSRPTPSTSEPRSAPSVFCTPGDKTFYCILTPLRCSRRRFRSGPLPLGTSPVSFLSAGQGPRPRLSRQVSLSPPTRTPSASTRLLFHPRAHVATT